MKTLIVAAVVGLIVASVSAHGGNRGGPGGGGGSREKSFGGRYLNCQCRSNQCTGNTGTKNFACNFRNQYLQCVNTACTNQTCPANQLFNSTTLQCESCKTGFQVDSQNRKCVCSTGTTLDKSTGTCGPCPTGATTTADRCYCAYPLVLNKNANACQACPTGSTASREGCSCANQQIFSQADFACKACPGTWVTVTKRQFSYQVCTCPDNQVLNRYSITCVTCPANSNLITDRDGSKCRCTVAGQVYDAKTNACVARSAFGSNGSSGSHGY